MTRGFAVVLTLLVLSAVWVAAWWSTQRTDYFPDFLKTTISECEPIPGWNVRQPVLHEGEEEWYSGELSGFNEPSLYRRPSDTLRSVRFTWLRSFHAPMIVRVDAQPDGRQQLTAKQHSIAIAFSHSPDHKPSQEIVRILTSKEASDLEIALTRSGLFNLPAAGCAYALDGAQWIIEGADPEHGYRFRKYQSPRTGMERDLGLFLLGLTEWDVGEIY